MRLLFVLLLASQPSASSLSVRDGALPGFTNELPTGLDWDPLDYSRGSEVTRGAVELGRKLFVEPALSASGQTSCATCHRPEFAFTDGLERAVGHTGIDLTRNTPTLINRAMGRSQFWDGRAEDLVEQALGPLLNPLEMGMTERLFDHRFGTDLWLESFRKGLGERPSLAGAARAIAAFEATLVSGDSAFDRFEWNAEDTALDAAAQRGLRLFRGSAGCSTCHAGPNLTDERFHDVGLATEDRGRGEATGRPEDLHRFKTPTLREIERTAPYMHDGRFATLEDVVEHYNRGGDDTPTRSPEIRQLGLTEEQRADLVAFLRALDGRVVHLSPTLFSAE